MGEKSVREFIFDDHITALSPDSVRAHLESQRFARIKLLFPTGRETLEERVRQGTNTLSNHFHFLRDFFEQMRAQKYCTTTYVFSSDDSGYEDHRVEITGRGYETFPLAGRAYFSEGKKSGQSTSIPVRSGADQFNLLLSALPRNEIPSFGNIEVDYQFSTEISLGTSHSLFTSNPLQVSKDFSSWDEKADVRHFFHGRPGNLSYRNGDAICQELFSILPGRDRPRLKFSAKVYASSSPLAQERTFIYEGPMDSTGTFPFFLRPDQQKTQEKTPPQTSPSLVTV